MADAWPMMRRCWEAQWRGLPPEVCADINQYDEDHPGQEGWAILYGAVRTAAPSATIAEISQWMSLKEDYCG